MAEGSKMIDDLVRAAVKAGEPRVAVPKEQVKALKLWAWLDVAEKRKPQSAVFLRRLEGRPYALVVETRPVKGGEDGEIWLLPREPIAAEGEDQGLSGGTAFERHGVMLFLLPRLSEEDVLRRLPEIDGVSWRRQPGERLFGSGEGLALELLLGGREATLKVSFGESVAAPARRRFARWLVRGWLPALGAGADEAFVEACRYQVADSIDEGLARSPGRDVLSRALNAAVDSGSLPLVERLLDAGADPNGLGEVTPLMIAARYGQLELLELLLSRGADVNRRTRDGRFALREAVVWPAAGKSCKPYQAVRLLVEGGADVAMKDGDGLTALMKAEADGDKDSAGCLRKLGG